MKCSHSKCRRKTNIVPYCWQHAEINLHVKIKKCTWLPEGNKGLFAFDRKCSSTPIFQKGQRILRYEGELLTEDEMSERYDYYDENGELVEGNAEYALEYESGKYVDAEIVKSYGAYINDPNGYTKHPDSLTPNSRFGKNRWIIAVRDIYDGDEILIDYGDNYFV